MPSAFVLIAFYFCVDRERATIAVAATLLILAVPSATGQIAAIVIGGVIGWLLLEGAKVSGATPLSLPVRQNTAVASLILFLALFLGLPVLQPNTAPSSEGRWC